MKRRDFLSTVTKASAGLGALSFFPFKTALADEGGDNENIGAEPERLDYDDTGWGICPVNCGSRCPLKVRIKDGTIKYVETDDTTDDSELGEKTQIRACIRGRSSRYRVYDPTRLKYPLKRVGKRGEGKFKRISWDEAYQIMADNIKRIKEKYGNEAFYFPYATGLLGAAIDRGGSGSPFGRLLNLYGGFTNRHGNYSYTNLLTAGKLYYGENQSSPASEMKKADLIVLFGANISETRMSGGGLNYYFKKHMADSTAKIIYIDPRYTDTAMNSATEWVPIRPGTDIALISAMLYVMVKENLHDQEFLDKYTIGWDEKHLPKDAPKNSSYIAYLNGDADGVEKTPLWAEAICGIPASQIVELAREIGNAKTAYIAMGYGPNRNINGEENTRAISLLATATGNVGKAGTGAGKEIEVYDNCMWRKSMPRGTNPVKQNIAFFTWTDAIAAPETVTSKTADLRGADKLKTPIKALFTIAGNPLNQHADINRTAEIMANEDLCEFIVDINVTLTPSGRYADLVLPDATSFEKVEFANQGYATPSEITFLIASNGAIKPVHETKSMFDMAAGVAEKLGIKDKFTEGKTREQWARELWAQTVESAKKSGYNPPEYDQMLKQGIYKSNRIGTPPVPAYSKFVNDPVKNPLKTPSGKIEIFSQTIHKYNNEWIWENEEAKGVTVPAYKQIEFMYDPNDTPNSQYPLQMFGFHAKGHTHSSYYDIEAIREVNPPSLWINPIDAEQRGIKDQDPVIINNQMGQIQVPARVTSRVRPGVVLSEQGVWYKKDPHTGIDVGGAINSLTTQKLTAISKANGQHSNLVQVTKA